MISKLSLRVSLAAGIVFMGILGIFLAWYVDHTYREMAVENQRVSIKEIVRLRVSDLFMESIKFSRDLGQSVQNNNVFRANLRQGRARDIKKHLQQHFHQYFVTAGVLKLTGLIAHGPELHLVASAVSEEARINERGGVPCPSLHLMAHNRKGVDRYKTVSQLCLYRGYPFMHVLIPIGGLKLVGYLEVIIDPVYTLTAIEKDLGMPVRILYLNGAIAYKSDQWGQAENESHGIVTQYVPQTDTGEDAMVLEVLHEVSHFEQKLVQTRIGLMITVTMATLMFALIMLLFIKRTTLDPLHQIGDYLRKIKKDNRYLGQKVEVSSNREIQELAEGLNEMTIALKSAYDELQQANIDLMAQIREREHAEIELMLSRDHLEELVEKRTADLAIARDTALRASQSKSQFLANMSHELRTPLNAIIGYTEILLEEAEENSDSSVGDLQKVHTAARRLLTIIKDILDLSKIEAGKIELDLDTFKILDLVEELKTTIAPLIVENENQFVIEQDGNIDRIFADRNKLGQALLNLLSNACKFTRKGKICLRIVRFNDNGSEKILFTVSDTGIGLSHSEMEKIFDAFTQADTSTTREYGGTGLGLAISRNFCQLMGGDLTVTSIKGEGSSFSIVIPIKVKSISNSALVKELSDNKMLSNPEYQRITHKLDNRFFERRSYVSSVLFLHKNEHVAMELCGYIQIKAFNTRLAASIDHGMELLLTQSFDVVVIDVDIAIEQGWDIMSEIINRSISKNIAVILLGDRDIAARGLVLGAVECLPKPVDKVSLHAAINNCVRLKAEQLAAQQNINNQ